MAAIGTYYQITNSTYTFREIERRGKEREREREERGRKGERDGERGKDRGGRSSGWVCVCVR